MKNHKKGQKKNTILDACCTVGYKIRKIHFTGTWYIMECASHSLDSTQWYAMCKRLQLKLVQFIHSQWQNGSDAEGRQSACCAVWVDNWQFTFCLTYTCCFFGLTCSTQMCCFFVASHMSCFSMPHMCWIFWPHIYVRFFASHVLFSLASHICCFV